MHTAQYDTISFSIDQPKSRSATEINLHFHSARRDTLPVLHHTKANRHVWCSATPGRAQREQGWTGKGEGFGAGPRAGKRGLNGDSERRSECQYNCHQGPIPAGEYQGRIFRLGREPGKVQVSTLWSLRWQGIWWRWDFEILDVGSSSGVGMDRARSERRRVA